MAKRLGLLDEVPRDPKARVASYASAVLVVVKDQLVGSRIASWQNDRVEYIHRGARGEMWVEDGALQCRHGKEQGSFPIGDLGRLTFSLQGEEMSIEIVAAETGGAEHSSQLSIRMLAGV